MASLSRFSAVAVLVSAVSGYAIGEIPTQTVGYGLPFIQLEPTEAPSLELVKKSLGKRAVINTCTEWTIPGGFGQPVCSNSETCLFTAATDGYFYEGCGQTSIAYDWVTECWPYPQIGTPPISQIYCPASAPSCGFLAFQFGDDATYYNFGCSTVSYSLYVDLLSTSNSSGAAQTSQSITLAGGGSSSITAIVTDTDFTEGGTATSTSAPIVIAGGLGTGTATSEPTPTQAGSSSGSTTRPTIGSHKKKKAPIGGIVGGVVGGIIAIVVVAFLIWFFIRKRRQDAAAQGPPTQEQQQPAMAADPAAYQSNNTNNNRISEIGGVMKPAPEHAGAFAPQQQYGNGNEKLAGQQVTEYPSPSPQSPPPMYAQPPQQAYAQPTQQPYAQPTQQIYAQPPPQGQVAQSAPTSPYPPSNYTELDNNQNLQPGSHASVGPVSAVGTYNSNATELEGAGTYQPPASPPNTHQQTYQHPPNMPEMSGTAASPQPVRQNGGFDMNGAPLSENYGHHELA